MKGGPALLQAALKRDDELKFVVIHDESNGTSETFIETNQHKLMNAAPVPNPSEPEEENVLLLPDVRVRVISNMFLIHGLIVLACFLLGLPFYFLQPTRQTSVIILIISSILFAVTYVSTIVFVQTRAEPRTIMASGIIWSMAAVGMVGSSAALMQNLAAFQLMLVIWVQAVTVYIYCKLSPRNINTKYAVAYMALSTILVWAVSIVAFAVDRDWIAAVTILVLACVCIAYNGLQIRMTEGRYSISWDDSILSIVQFYGDPVLLLVKACR